MELDQFQLNHCVGHMGYRICDPYMVQISTQQPKCSLRLFRNNPRDINGHCDVEFYESSDYPTEVVPLGNGQVLLATNKTRWTVNCDKQSPRILQGCKFCVLHLNWNGMELGLFNDDTCPSGHISRPTHFSDILCNSFVFFNYLVIWILWLVGFNVPYLTFIDLSNQVEESSLLQIFNDR